MAGENNERELREDYTANRGIHQDYTLGYRIEEAAGWPQTDFRQITVDADYDVNGALRSVDVVVHGLSAEEGRYSERARIEHPQVALEVAALGRMALDAQLNHGPAADAITEQAINAALAGIRSERRIGDRLPE